jgi:hypothetical protein
MYLEEKEIFSIEKKTKREGEGEVICFSYDRK